jgi:hypothetical protein
MARRKQGSEENLVTHLDDFFLNLMTEAYPQSVAEILDDGAPKIGFVDRVRLFDSGVRWVMVKNKVSPEEEEDAFAAARKRAIGGTRRRSAPGSSVGTNGSA